MRHLQQSLFRHVILKVLLMPHGVVSGTSSILLDDGRWVYLSVVGFLFKEEPIGHVLLALENREIFNRFVLLQTVLSS